MRLDDFTTFLMSHKLKEAGAPQSEEIDGNLVLMNHHWDMWEGHRRLIRDTYECATHIAIHKAMPGDPDGTARAWTLQELIWYLRSDPAAPAVWTMHSFTGGGFQLTTWVFGLMVSEVKELSPLNCFARAYIDVLRKKPKLRAESQKLGAPHGE